MTGITNDVGSTWVTPVYDAAGNMTRGPRPGAESTATEGLLCVWDGWDRLARVYKDNGGGSADGSLATSGASADAVIAQYQYDGRGFRIVKLPDRIRRFYVTNSKKADDLPEAPQSPR